MSRILSCVGVTLVLGVGVASAEDSKTTRDVRTQAYELVQGRKTLRVNADGGGSVADCRAHLAADAAEGAKPDDTIDHAAFEGMPKAFKDKQDRWSIHFADAGQICDELERIAGASRVMEHMAETNRELKFLIQAADNPSYVGAKTLEDVKKRVGECRAGVVTLTAVAKTYKLTDVENKSGFRMNVATVGADVCDALEKQIPAYEKLVEAKAAADKVEWQKTLEPYKKAGAAGEKLEFLGSMDGTALYAVGGKEMTTPKAKAAASVMFEVLTGNGVTVRRYTFKGNKSTGMSQKEYPVRPGASAFK